MKRCTRTEQMKSRPGYATFQSTRNALRTHEHRLMIDGRDLALMIEDEFDGSLGESKANISIDRHENLFACCLVENRLIVLTKFPRWKTWKAGGQTEAHRNLWSAIQAVVGSTSLANQPELRIHVGIQGAMLWAYLMEGRSSGPPTTSRRVRHEAELAAWFDKIAPSSR